MFLNKPISPKEAMIRSTTAPVGINIGPSGAGKSTAMRKCVGAEIGQALSVAVGNTSQTTIIPFNVVLDERIVPNQFALKINRIAFNEKNIDSHLEEKLLEPAIDVDFDFEEMKKEITSKWFNEVIEPLDKAYHLGQLTNLEEKRQKLIEALAPIFEVMSARDFDADVQESKKSQKTKVKISVIREGVFERYWSEVSSEARSLLTKWYCDIGKEIEQLLEKNVREIAKGDIVEYSTNRQDDSLPYGLDVLTNLVDPFQPFSMVVDSISMACKPPEELTKEKKYKDVPYRLVIRDTMGLNQTAANPSAIRDSLEMALNNKADFIVLYFGLDEKDEVLIECCKALNENQRKSNELKVPVYIIFSKADVFIKNRIAKMTGASLVLNQENYTKGIDEAVDVLQNRIDSFKANLPEGQIKWFSLINQEADIDPILMALLERKPELANRFKREGFYYFYNEIVDDTYTRILPNNLERPVSITVKDIKKPAATFTMDCEKIEKSLEEIRELLSVDKSNVNGYLITDNRRINGKSVVAYWSRLQEGLPYSTNAHVFGNFQIFMKGLLLKVLRSSFKPINELFKDQILSIDLNNLEDSEVERLVSLLDPNGEYKDKFTQYLSPDVQKNMSERDINTQIIYTFYCDYLSETHRKSAILDRMAFDLSINAPEIKNMMAKIYYSNQTYDTIIREMQKQFQELYGSEFFKKLLVDVFCNEATSLANKLFITD